MLRFEIHMTQPSSVRETPPIQGLSGASSFSQVFNEVRGEVTDFIRHGSGALDPIPVTAEARVWQMQQQGLSASASEPALDGRSMQSFWEGVAPMAREAGARLGVAPEIIAAQAALETGWGTRPLRHADGRDTHNLFALKANKGWSGETANVTTTEFVDGMPSRQVEPFRSYASAQGAFDDFARLLLSSPRYQGALNTGSDVRAYARGLVQGGYATDPAYADKLAGIVTKFHSVD